MRAPRARCSSPHAGRSAIGGTAWSQTIGGRAGRARDSACNEVTNSGDLAALPRDRRSAMALRKHGARQRQATPQAQIRARMLA